MTIDITEASLRARAYWTKDGRARLFHSLSKYMKEQIEFVRQSDGSFLALWREGGEGEEPPPYWADDVGKVHNL